MEQGLRKGSGRDEWGELAGEKRELLRIEVHIKIPLLWRFTCILVSDHQMATRNRRLLVVSMCQSGMLSRHYYSTIPVQCTDRVLLFGWMIHDVDFSFCSLVFDE